MCVCAHRVHGSQTSCKSRLSSPSMWGPSDWTYRLPGLGSRCLCPSPKQWSRFKCYEGKQYWSSSFYKDLSGVLSISQHCSCCLATIKSSLTSSCTRWHSVLVCCLQSQCKKYDNVRQPQKSNLQREDGWRQIPVMPALRKPEAGASQIKAVLFRASLGYTIGSL